MAKTAATIIERETHMGIYDLPWTEAIIDHPTHRRLYIAQGFGGMSDLSGGAYRWRHGIVCQLQPTDTFAVLRERADKAQAHIFELMASGRDCGRPALDWSGSMIAACAEAAGL